MRIDRLPSRIGVDSDAVAARSACDRGSRRTIGALAVRAGGSAAAGATVRVSAGVGAGAVADGLIQRAEVVVVVIVVVSAVGALGW